MSLKQRFALAGIIALGVVLLDQIAKWKIQQTLALYASKEAIPGFFNLVHTMNRGAAFGFQNNPDGAWQPYFFMGVTALAIVIIINLLARADNGSRLFVVALGLILGGAAGNMIDRLRYGQVVDFLEFYVKSFVWPAFNVADIGITLGSIALIISFYTRPKAKA